MKSPVPTNTQPDRLDEIYQALNEAMAALYDIDALCDLLQAQGDIQKVGFPEHIAGAIRMIGYRTSATLQQLEEVA